MPKPPKKSIHFRKTARLKILHVLKKFHGTMDLSPSQIAEHTELPVQTVYYYLTNYLKERGYVEAPRRGYWRITTDGTSYLGTSAGVKVTVD